MKKITTILFDLDGTLLPLDPDTFVRGYFGRLAAKMAGRGYDPKKLLDAIRAGSECMVKNDGTRTNEEAFWLGCNSAYGENVERDRADFEEFYKNEFQQVQGDCGFTPETRRIVDLVKSRGFKLVLATNPLFPAIATESRIRWAGLSPDEFLLYTTYENSSYCKPNLDYYRDILSRIGTPAEECLMVGNDVDEDMIAEKLGMQVFLLTDCILNKHGKDISAYPQGSFDDLAEYIEAL